MDSTATNSPSRRLVSATDLGNQIAQSDDPLASAKAAFAETCAALGSDDATSFKEFVLDSFTSGTVLEHKPTAASSSVFSVLSARLPILAMLMILQSFSSIVLNSYSEFIQKHMVVALYLTMLVGAGGNAGNQTAVLFIRGIATGKVRRFSQVVPELINALALGLCLVIVGFSRVYLFGASLGESFGITLSLFLIVTSSVVIGAVLPLLLLNVGFDAAHAGPTIQVVMDISGVWITCGVCWTLSKNGLFIA